MLDEPDLFISLNTCGGGTSVNSVCSGVTTLKRDGTMRHTCPGSGGGTMTSVNSVGSSVQLHDIQCVPASSYNSSGYGPDPRQTE